MRKGQKLLKKKGGKARIIDGAIASFVRNGVAQTTLKQITEAAGVDQPLFHYYFNSLDELYAEVVQKVRESLAAASVAILDENADPLTQIRGYIKGTLIWGARNPGLYSIWIYFYYLATFKPEASRLNASIRAVGRNRVELMVHRGIEQGLFKPPPGASTGRIAFCIHTFLTGALVVGGSGASSAKERAAHWEQTVARTVEGVIRWLGVKD